VHRTERSPDPVFDGHNDLAWALHKLTGGDLDALDPGDSLLGRTHTDLPRLAAGGVGAQFWSVYVPSTLGEPDALVATLCQIDLVHRMIERHPDRLVLATTAAGVRDAAASGRIGSLLGAEGGHCIASSLGVLRMLHRLDVRYLTLTHNHATDWADSATDTERSGGLSGFGRDVVREMNRLGIIVDLSHVAVTTMHDALDITANPILFSHSSARALVDHPRNVPDEVLARLPANGGVCQVTFVPAFVCAAYYDWTRQIPGPPDGDGLDHRDLEKQARGAARFALDHPRPRATVADVADHIDHVRDVAGIDHVGIGGDYDGVDVMPEGLEDVTCYPRLLAELRSRGWSPENLARLSWRNVLRVVEDSCG
jgi:membrane dipeptidase